MSRNYRPIWIVLAFFAMTAILTAIVVFFQKIEGPSHLANNIIVFALFNVDLILLIVLVLLLSRNFIKLYLERRQNIMGAKFRTRLVLYFLSAVIIPSILLFFVALGLLTNVIESWFNIQVENSLKNSLEVAQTYYQNSQDNALYYSKQISKTITEGGLLDEQNRHLLKEVVAKKAEEYNLGVVEIFSAQVEELVKILNPQIPEGSFVRPQSDLIKTGLKGKEITNIQSLGKGDIIRGVVPIYSSFNYKDIVGVVVVNYYISQSLVNKMEAITGAYEEYKQLKAFKNPIKGSYIMVFLLITLIIIFAGTWFGFHLAKDITVPIQKLAEGTQAIAQGDLNFKIVDIKARDEIGMLVNSFNKMTDDLKFSNERLAEANISLQKGNIELDRRRGYIETVLESIATGVISVDRDGRITTFNSSAEKILGIPASDVIGKHYQSALHLLPLDKVQELINKMRSQGKAAIEEELQVGLNNKLLRLGLNITALRDEDNNYLGLVIVFEDLTELIKAQRVAAWQEVAKRIAHEIKNPLTPIQLSAQRLRKKFHENAGDFNNIFDECTNTIIHEVNSIKSLVNEFYNFARMPAARPAPNDLHEIINEVVPLYRSAHKDINIINNFEDGLPVINVDKEQFKRVFVNLFENAVEAMNNKGRVWVNTHYDSDLNLVKVEVADEGAGINPDDKDKLFLPYFSKKKTGTGLGLAIVNRIIADHSGYIRVTDNKPKGTTFVIELPVKAA
ncbi:MAG: PAS domain-containing protein [Nitrospirae bacterium]|nr:PAS domain-containing protein [Nitrospirota bacterium]